MILEIKVSKVDLLGNGHFNHFPYFNLSLSFDSSMHCILFKIVSFHDDIGNDEILVSVYTIQSLISTNLNLICTEILLINPTYLLERIGLTDFKKIEEEVKIFLNLVFNYEIES